MDGYPERSPNVPLKVCAILFPVGVAVTFLCFLVWAEKANLFESTGWDAFLGIGLTTAFLTVVDAVATVGLAIWALLRALRRPRAPSHRPCERSSSASSAASET